MDRQIKVQMENVTRHTETLLLIKQMQISNKFSMWEDISKLGSSSGLNLKKCFHSW